MANGPMRNSRRAMVTHPTKRSSVALNQAIEIAQGVLPREFQSWDEVPGSLMPTPTTMDAKATNDLEVTQKFLDQGRQTCLTYEVTLMNDGGGDSSNANA